jgi:hypothetical protein
VTSATLSASFFECYPFLFVSFDTELVAGHGRIKLLRESPDTIRAAQALFPNGLADLPNATDSGKREILFIT